MKKQSFQPPNEMNIAIAMTMNGRLFEDFRQTQPQGNSRGCVRFEDVERTLEEIIIDASAWLGSSYEGTDLSWIG